MTIIKKLAKKHIIKMRDILIESITDRFLLDEIEQNDIDDIDYIESLERYDEFLEEFLRYNDISGINIYTQSGFLDPKNKFDFLEYNDQECEKFRDYLVEEYGIERSIIE